MPVDLIFMMTPSSDVGDEGKGWRLVEEKNVEIRTVFEEEAE